MQTFTRGCSHCFQITKYVPSIFTDIASRRIKEIHCMHLNGTKSKAALEYTTLLEYIEISICDCYQLKLCQSISFFHDFLKLVAKFLEMGDFSHSQGQTAFNNSPTANKERDFLARLMTSDYAVPWYGLIPWIGPMDTLSRKRSKVTLSICFHQKTLGYFNGEQEETCLLWSAPGIEE